MEFLQITESEYDVFQKQHLYRDFMNSIQAMELKRMSQWQVEYVGVKEGDTLLCASALTSLPVMKIFRFYYAQRGFLIDYENKELLSFFVEHLKSYLKSKKALYLLVDPNVLYRERDIDSNLVDGGFDNSYVVENLQAAGLEHQGFTKNFQVLSAIRWVSTLYLQDKDEKSVLQGMRQLTRRSIKKVNKEGIKVRELSLSELSIFTDMLDHTGQRRNFDVRSYEFYENQAKAFGEDCQVLLAYMDVNEFVKNLEKDLLSFSKKINDLTKKLELDPDNKKNQNKKEILEQTVEASKKKLAELKELQSKHGDIINMATSFFITQGDECVYLYGAAYDEFKKYNAPYAIQWHMIQESLKKGIKRYNFYGISGDFNEDAVDYGVYEFKKGFGAIVEELVGDFVLPIRPLLYTLYKKLKNK